MKNQSDDLSLIRSATVRDLIIFHLNFFKLQATPDHTKKRKGGRRPAPKKDKDVKASASAEESDEEEEQEDCSAKPKCLKPVGKEVCTQLFIVFRTILNKYVLKGGLISVGIFTFPFMSEMTILKFSICYLKLKSSALLTFFDDVEIHSEIKPPTDYGRPNEAFFH